MKFSYQQLPVCLKLIYTILQVLSQCRFTLRPKWTISVVTSQKFCVKEMSKFEEPDILFNMMNCLKILCLHGECLYLARKDHPQFLAYIQQKMLIPWYVSSNLFSKNTQQSFSQPLHFTHVLLCSSLWSMLKSEFCQLASLAVPQLLHALSLSHGADIFWNLINLNFNNNDWKIRFEAGQRQT